MAWYRFGPATVISPRSLIPDFGSASTFAIFAMMALAYDGLELGPVMGGEIRDPRRVMPRAILVARICIAFIYMAGTARIPFVIGVDRYLPPALGKLHSVHGTPWVALLVQGVVGTAAVLMALAGATIREAFVLLIDMSAILTFVPLLYLFAALPVLRRRARGCDAGVTLEPGGAAGSWLCGGAGFVTTALATVTSMIPPTGSNHMLFLLKVIGGSALLVGVGLVFFERGRRVLARVR